MKSLVRKLYSHNLVCSIADVIPSGPSDLYGSKEFETYSTRSSVISFSCTVLNRSVTSVASIMSFASIVSQKPTQEALIAFLTSPLYLFRNSLQGFKSMCSFYLRYCAQLIGWEFFPG